MRLARRSLYSRRLAKMLGAGLMVGSSKFRSRAESVQPRSFMRRSLGEMFHAEIEQQWSSDSRMNVAVSST